MVLGDVEETATTVQIDEETYEEIVQVGCCFTMARIVWCWRACSFRLDLDLLQHPCSCDLVTHVNVIRA